MAVTFSASTETLVQDNAATSQLTPVSYSDLFSSVFLKPQWDSFVYHINPQYTATYVLSYLAQGDDVALNDTVNWAERGTLNIQQTITSATVSGRTATIVLTETERYFVVGDIIVLSSGVQAQVTAVTTGPQTLTVQSLGTANLVDGTDVVDGSKIWRIGAGIAPCAAAPTGTTYVPTQRTASVSQWGKTKEWCVDAMSAPQWITAPDGKNYQFFRDEVDFIEEVKSEFERAVVFGQATTGTMSSGFIAGAGMIPLIQTYGSSGSIAGAWTEDDFIEVLNQMSINGNGHDEWVAFCGVDAMTSIIKFTKDYRRIENSVFTDAYKKSKGLEFGMDLTTYKFGTRTVTIMEYPYFNDIPATTTIDYKGAIMFLNVAKDVNGPKCQILYKKEFNGIKKKMYRTKGPYGHGTVENGGDVTQVAPKWNVTYSNKFILKMVALNTHGFFYVAVDAS